MRLSCRYRSEPGRPCRALREAVELFWPESESGFHNPHLQGPSKEVPQVQGCGNLPACHAVQSFFHSLQIIDKKASIEAWVAAMLGKKEKNEEGLVISRNLRESANDAACHRSVTISCKTTAQKAMNVLRSFLAYSPHSKSICIVPFNSAKDELNFPFFL